MLSSLVWFLVYSIPPLFGWWLAFRAPLGRRRFERSINIAAPFDTVWNWLDPRSASGGWVPLFETQNARVVRETPLAVAYFRRPRFSEEVLTQAVDVCDVDADARCIQRIEREVDGQRLPSAQSWKCAWRLTPEGEATRVTLTYERPTTGILAYEMTRLSLRADLDALHDAVVGNDPKVTPLFRFSGWRMAILGLVSALLMIALLLAPAFYIALDALGMPPRALLADRALAGFLLTIAGAMIVYLTAVFVFCTLVHEMGHALALVGFGHRGVMVSLLPFGGGVAMGARACASAFEAGVVSLAGPAFSAAVALALLPNPEKLSALLRYATASDAMRANMAAPGLDSLWAMTGALIAFCTLVINVPNILPWTGSDGAQALRAIFSTKRMRVAGAVALTLLLAFAFARIDDLLPFTLLFVALTWFNRNRAAREFHAAGGAGQRAMVAAALALTVGLYAYEAAFLRGMV